MLSEPVTVALLRETVRLLVETHQLDLHAVITKHNFEKIKALVYGDALLASYGSFASYWSMVDEENYAAARRLAFAGKEAEYAAFLQKIDFYHYEIQQKLPQTLRALQKQGLPIGNLSKYGFQMIPLLEDSSRVGDEMLDLYACGGGQTGLSVARLSGRRFHGGSAGHHVGRQRPAAPAVPGKLRPADGGVPAQRQSDRRHRSRLSAVSQI